MRPGVKNFFFLTGIFLAFWVGFRCLLPIFLPFLLGALIALAAEPGVLFLTGKLKLPRALASGIAVTAAVLCICALITVVCAFLLKELGAVAGALPDMELTAAEGMNVLRDNLLSLAGRSPRSLRPVLQRGVREFFSGSAEFVNRGVQMLLQTAGDLLTHVPGSAFGIGTAVIAGFLISARLPRIKGWLRSHFSRERLRQLLSAANQLRQTLMLWLLAQLKLSGISFAVLTAGFALLGIGHALLWALLTAVVDVLPVLGTGIVLLPWSFVCLLQGQTARAVGLVGIYGTVVILRSLLEPKMVGAQLGLDPLITLVTLYAGFRLWGVGGMLLLPLLTVCALRLLPGKK